MLHIWISAEILPNKTLYVRRLIDQRQLNCVLLIVHCGSGQKRIHRTIKSSATFIPPLFPAMSGHSPPAAPPPHPQSPPPRPASPISEIPIASWQRPAFLPPPGAGRSPRRCIFPCKNRVSPISKWLPRTNLKIIRSRATISFNRCFLEKRLAQGVVPQGHPPPLLLR